MSEEKQNPPRAQLLRYFRIESRNKNLIQKRHKRHVINTEIQKRHVITQQIEKLFSRFDINQRLSLYVPTFEVEHIPLLTGPKVNSQNRFLGYSWKKPTVSIFSSKTSTFVICPHFTDIT